MSQQDDCWDVCLHLVFTGVSFILSVRCSQSKTNGGETNQCTFCKQLSQGCVPTGMQPPYSFCGGKLFSHQSTYYAASHKHERPLNGVCVWVWVGFASEGSSQV